MNVKNTLKNWHNQSVKTVLTELNTIPSGLSRSEAEERLKACGRNILPEPAKRSALIRFGLQFHNVLIYVLLGSATITAFLGHLVDTLVILAVVLANAIIGFVQEGKAQKAMEAIRNMLTSHASVLRAGKRRSVRSEILVPGDIVLLEAGDKVPADLRIIESHGLFIQEAILTGESVPVEKYTKAVAMDAALGDRSCMAFSGTLVTGGQGKAVVVGTGMATEVGRISGLLSKVEMLTTPLVKQMDIFAKWLTVFIILVAATLLAYGYFVGHHEFTEIFMVVVGLSVAAIPEGLPAVITITLAIGTRAMARRNAIIRRLPAIETLGSVSVICTDKTGTLTRNEMMIASVATHAHLYTIEGSGYEPKGAITFEDVEINISEHAILDEMARASALCNDAALHEHEGAWAIEGDPMEGALLSFASKAGINLLDEINNWHRTDAIPFDAKHRFMATLSHNNDKRTVIFVKGAPERIINMCKGQRVDNGKTEPINKEYWYKRAEEIASKGQRVLSLAVRNVKSEHIALERDDVEGTLIFLGMVGLIDPPRNESINAIAECHNAGICVKMITGDHASTASAIGRHIGLKNVDKVITGTDIDKMDDAALKSVVLDTDIFARTSPEHKLRLVMALQSLGMTVAMTGDGVNDAPALKRANAGIAMGKSGSDVAKEAAELVLVDDNFASIVGAIREGRTVYDNLKKFISWTLPTNAGESMIIIVALLFGFTLPITPIQILWINLITASTLGLALAFEPSEEKTMLRPPRRRNAPILTAGLLWHIVLLSALFLCGVYGVYSYAIERGYSLELARTIVVNTLVVMEIFHLFFIRNIYETSLTWKAVRATKVVWITVIIVIVGQLAMTYLPPMQKIFTTEAIPFFDLLIIIGIGVMLFVIVEAEKQIRLFIRGVA
jgi:magnesium-transporting ATPase (P-type)